jgi:hypothetical protein
MRKFHSVAQLSIAANAFGLPNLIIPDENIKIQKIVIQISCTIVNFTPKLLAMKMYRKHFMMIQIKIINFF